MEKTSIVWVAHTRANAVIVLFLLLLPMLACGSTNSLRPGERGIEVDRQMFGDDWPFEKIEAGTVVCETGEWTAVVFQASETGIRYALNGVAKTRYSYQYPREAGILREIPYEPPNENLGTYLANDEALVRLCDQ